MRHLLGQQTDGDCAGEVESERDEEPRRKQAAERRAAHGGDGDRDEQAEQAQRAAGREDVPVLHARRDHHVGQHEGEGAHAAKRDQVPRDEGRRAERARCEDGDVCFPGAQHEEARHREPAHRRRDGPLLRGDMDLWLHIVFRGGVQYSFSAWGRGECHRLPCCPTSVLPRHILEQNRYHHPNDEPDACHDPTGARVPIEDGIPESDLVHQTAEEWADGEAGALADDEPPGQGRPTAHTDDARIGAVTLAVHELREGHAHHDSADEDEVEEVGSIGQGIKNAPDQC